MGVALKPICMLADSQLLFSKRAPIASFIVGNLNCDRPKAAYIGASNGDEPAFYDIFKAAMSSMGLDDTRMIQASFSEPDRRYLENADLILLAGGDVARGWDVLATTGMAETVRSRFEAGSLLFGVSAGSVQLGLRGRKTEQGQTTYFETLGLAPFLVDCHDEAGDWEALQDMVACPKFGFTGLGIPFGGGLFYHPDHTVQPFGKPVVEFSRTGEGLSRNLLYPDRLKQFPPGDLQGEVKKNNDKNQ